MEAPDIKAFVWLVLLGMPFGILSAYLFRGTRNPFILTAVGSFWAGTLGVLSVFFVMGAIHSLESGHPLGWAMHAGFGAVLLLSFTVPFISGGPAVVAGMVCQFFIQRCCRRDREDQPPPLPG